MSREFSRRLYKSKEWERVREQAIRRPVELVNGRICPPGMCERCWRAGKAVPAEIVHHKVFLTPDNVSDPRIALGLDNLMRVCRDCHAEIHYPADSSPRVGFDANGRPVPLGQEERR